MKVNIREKKTGDLLTATEVNLMVSGINDNADTIDTFDKRISDATNNSSVAMNTSRNAQQKADETAGKLAKAVSDAEAAAAGQVTAAVADIRKEVTEAKAAAAKAAANTAAAQSAADNAEADAANAKDTAGKAWSKADDAGVTANAALAKSAAAAAVATEAKAEAATAQEAAADARKAASDAAANVNITGGSIEQIQDGEKNILRLDKGDGSRVIVELPEGTVGKSGNTINVTKCWPLSTGFYTLPTAIAAVKGKQRVKGAVITYETAAGVWETRQYSGTDLAGWTASENWKEFGGGGKIKGVRVNGDTLDTDDAGVVDIFLPTTPTVDDTLIEGSTNPVSGGAVAAKFKEQGANYGTSLRLDESGEGADKKYAISLLDSDGNVLNTTDQFSGGGGGTAATNKIVLTRVTPNLTVKSGDEVHLVYTYDHVATDTGASTGNPAHAVITLIRGAYAMTEERTLIAGSTDTLDLTKFLGVGSNTVRVRVTVGEGTEAQVSQLSWTVTVVQLMLSSSWNIATIINRGDVVNIPYALTGSGSKTLRCYVDGTDTDSRIITASTANGQFSITTAGMSHGNHSVQLVAELNTPTGVIRSNSIYFDMAVREIGNGTPIVAARFDQADGAVAVAGEHPTVIVRQFDNYRLQYAAFDPHGTPARVAIYEGARRVAQTSVGFVRSEYIGRALTEGEMQGRVVVGATTYDFIIRVGKSNISLTEPTDGIGLKLTSTGRSNSDIDRDEWRFNDVKTTFENMKWGGDGWTGENLRLTGSDRAIIGYHPFEMGQNATNALAMMVRFRVSDVIDESAEVIRCMDSDGTGFVITAQEARLASRGGSVVTTKFAAGENYEIGFVAWPKAGADATAEERRNDAMLYLYVNGVMSGAVQRGNGDSIYQAEPQDIVLGSDACTLEVSCVRCYTTYLTDSQMLDAYMVDLGSAEALMAKFSENNVLDAATGEIRPESLPDDLPYLIITGQQENGVATLLQAAVNNNKKKKYDVEDILYVNRAHPEKNFRVQGGMVQLQGTSSLAYPTKNYKIFTYGTDKKTDPLFIGCSEQGVGGVLQEDGLYSFRDATATAKAAAPVNRWCLKADYAESSSSHNTGMANMVQRALTAAGELTPPQNNVSDSYPYEVRTTVDGFPVMLFYRKTISDSPVFLGKYNFNNDKSTEAVFGFRDIPGYHDQAWVTERFGGKNPVQCWEFLNNDYPMGMFLDDDFERKESDGTLSWQKVFEGRFPDGGTDAASYLAPLVKWVKSCKGNPAKFKTEVDDYFDVDYLCDYYMLTEMMGAVDQRVKNMMLSFFYHPGREKVLGYFIFYDNDTIMGVRNDGRLKYGYDIDENTIDMELSTADKTVYAYAGHDSVLWQLVRECLQQELQAAYIRLRRVLTNEAILNIFDKEQSAKFCERIYNKDSVLKYVVPKTEGVTVLKDGQVTKQTYSYLEAMQGSRTAHRHWWLRNRLAMLDAKYATGQYPSTDLTFKGNSAAGATIRAWSGRDFYFGFSREGQMMAHDKVHAGQEWSYTYSQMANVGTIFHFYGGEYARKMDLSEWGGFTDLTLPMLPRLEELVLGAVGKTYTLTEIAIGTKLRMLRTLDVRNYTKLTTLDLSGCIRLESVNADGCSSLSTLTLAQGAPVRSLALPAGFQTLSLRQLPDLERGGIVFGDIRTLTGLRVEGCAKINGLALMNEILAIQGNSLRYVRVDGIDLEGDGTELLSLEAQGIGGIDMQGNTVEGCCKLIGVYRLTRYMEESVYSRLKVMFDELDLRQPVFTMIEFDDTVPDDTNVSNLDNGTGYKTGTAYIPSGHISAILKQRHRVLAKVTKKATTRNVNMAGQDVAVPNLDGEMTYCPLDDSDSNKYVDGSVAKLDGTEGDWMMYEPFFWSKGVNDYLNGKHYSCYCSNDREHKPESPEATIVLLDAIKETQGGYLTGKKILSGKDTLQNSYTNDTAYSVCKVRVEGYKRVRFPSVPGTNLIGSVFVDTTGKVVSSVVVPTIGDKFEAGMYLIADVPETAVNLHFTILNTAEFDCVVLSNSSRIEDMEPEWVANDEHLCAVVGSTVVGSKLRAAITGGSTTASLTWTDFHYYSVQRGMQQIDALMHSRIANLFFARYGRRDAQEQCGAGSHTYNRTTGGTASRGMQDTVGYAEASRVNSEVKNSIVEFSTHQYAWYRSMDEYGGAAVTQVNNICCLGYEDIYGNKWDMMDGVDVPNDSGNNGKWRIWMPDGSVRWVKATTNSDYWITAVAHGKYMDVIPVGKVIGSSSTYYGDKYWFSGAKSRVVYRGYLSAFAAGGVSLSDAGNGASDSYASAGSRLAFRGKIVKAQSVAAYKAVSEVA